MGKVNWGEGACALFLVCAAAAIALPAQTFITLFRFDKTDGANPTAGLVQATDGNFYGTTYAGGSYDLGTVFKITPSGTLTTLHSFCSESGCTDGENPQAGLVQATDGNFYGTTFGNGTNRLGTVFKITPSGTLTTLHSFDYTDGEQPEAALVQATDGDFYGTTFGGGVNGNGTVFKITPSGTLTTVYSFGFTDGENPFAGLVQATDGNFYGTTYLGGVYDVGTVFKITPSGTLTTLHSFCSETNCADGVSPFAGLVQATDGNFYGTTYAGGADGNDFGTVFKVTPSGTLTTLHSFCSQSGCTDGENPQAGLVQATDGNLYGTTTGGGANGAGTVFKITPSGTLTALHSFCSESGCTDGRYPEAALVQATNGKFYGTPGYGGVSSDCKYGCGTVFSLSVGLGPFVETQPASGKVGAAVKILGTSLTGATSVTFNGTAAHFKVVSGGSEITTAVPADATTGKLKVVTPKRTLSSNVNFRVLP
jgi:uncharacterized repeat protein (TIGR03803 family)